MEIAAPAQLDPQMRNWIASPWHLVVVLGVMAPLSYGGLIATGKMRAMVNPNRIGMYERTIVVEWLVLGLVLAGVIMHGSSAATVLGERWRSPLAILRDLGIAVLFLMAAITVTSLVGGHDGAENTRFLLPQGSTEMALWVVLSVTAGICEEAVYRGYLQRQFMALTRSIPAGVVLSGVAFGASHLYQGWRPAFSIGLLGVMNGVLAHWRRSVRPGMLAHTLQDLLGGFLRPH